MKAEEISRVYGYVRASTDKQIASPDTQKQIIDEYARRMGKTVDRYFIDHAVSGKKRLHDRQAGRELMATLRPRDTVIVARLDRLSGSFIGFAQILDAWTKLKIGIHLCDMPGGHLDPDNPMSEMMIGILIVFANYERRLISVRTREGLQALKQRGERYCRWAEYGWRREKRHDPKLGKTVNVKVADLGERAIMAKCVELRAAGQSLDKIRQHLNYEMKARTRLGGHWTTGRIGVLVQQGLRFTAENVNGTNALLASVDEEEDIVVLSCLDSANMKTHHSSTVVGVFQDRLQANQAVTELDEAGFDKSQVGIAMRHPGDQPDDLIAAKDTHAGSGALAGALTGLGLGALAGLGVLAGVIPVVGHAIAAGTLGVVLSNAAAGASIAGLVGALVGAGIPEEEAKYYQGEFEAGRAIVTVNACSQPDEAWQILERHGAYDVNSRRPATAST